MWLIGSLRDLGSLEWRLRDEDKRCNRLLFSSLSLKKRANLIAYYRLFSNYETGKKKVGELDEKVQNL